MALHFNYDEFAAIELHAVSILGDALQAGDHEATQGLKAFIAGKLQLVIRFQVTDVLSTIEHHRSPGKRERRRFIHVELVFKLAHNLFQHIFHADDAYSRATLIHHDGQVTPPLLELGQQVSEWLGIGHHHHVTHDVADLYSRRKRKGSTRLAQIRKAYIHQPGHIVGI